MTKTAVMQRSQGGHQADKPGIVRETELGNLLANRGYPEWPFQVTFFSVVMKSLKSCCWDMAMIFCGKKTGQISS
jgi:hypothetical protein